MILTGGNNNAFWLQKYLGLSIKIISHYHPSVTIEYLSRQPFHKKVLLADGDLVNEKDSFYDELTRIKKNLTKPLCSDDNSQTNKELQA